MDLFFIFDIEGDVGFAEQAAGIDFGGL